MWLFLLVCGNFLRKNMILVKEKPGYFENKVAWAFETVRKNFTKQKAIIKSKTLNITSLRFKKRKLSNTFKLLSHENEAISRFTSWNGTTWKIFPTLLDMKNANRAQKNSFQNITKDRMADFNISVAVKQQNVINSL